MAKKLLFLIWILISVQLIFAQDYYIKGYIIKQNGDTTHGFINDLDWYYNPDIIEFREDSASVIIRYTPKDITEFRTKKNFYISYKGNVDLTPVRHEDLHEDLEIYYDTVSTFLKVLNKGKLNLYEYHSFNPKKYIYLIQKENEKITELIYQRKMYLKNGKRLIQTNEFYKNQLESYLFECKNAVKSIYSAKYNLYSISKRVNIYNTCGSENEPEYYIQANIYKETEKDYFIKGYIIKKNGDIMHGLINDLNWLYNPEFIEFIKDSSSSVQKFSSNDIVGFKTKENYYISYSGKLDKTPVNLEDLYEKDEINIEYISTFLRVINEGKINLYEYNSANPKKYIYLIQKEKGVITELIFQKKMYKKNGKRYVQTNEFYKNQLNSYLLDCKDAVKSINSVKYNLKSLNKRVNIYNTCGSEDKSVYLDYEKGKKPKMNLNLFSGISVNSISFESLYIFTNHIQFKELAISYMPGISFERFILRGRRSSSLTLSLFYNSFVNESIAENYSFKYKYILSSKNIKLAGAYKKYLIEDNKQLRPYIYIGYFRLFGAVNLKAIPEDTTQTNSYEYDYDYFPLNFKIGGGLNIKDKFVVGFSYDYYLLNLSALRYRTLNFFVGYSFNF